jgi:hypothetical protein
MLVLFLFLVGHLLTAKTEHGRRANRHAFS